VFRDFSFLFIASSLCHWFFPNLFPIYIINVCKIKYVFHYRSIRSTERVLIEIKNGVIKYPSNHLLNQSNFKVFALCSMAQTIITFYNIAFFRNSGQLLRSFLIFFHLAVLRDFIRAMKSNWKSRITIHLTSDVNEFDKNKTIINLN
jgi:hypothetical protein